MATNHQLNTPGRSRLYLHASKEGRFELRFYPRPCKSVGAVTLVKAFAKLDHPDAEHALKSVLPVGFCREAEGRGLSLVECMKEAKAILRYANEVPENLIPDDQLAAILGGLAPGMDPAILLMNFRKLLKKRGGAAVRMLRECEDRFGRDGKDGRGYIRMSSPASQPTQP